MRYPSLLSPITVGPYALPNRVFLAPLTRVRATPDGVPTPLMAEYYAQRAGGGLLISEATAISAQGNPMPGVPGLYTAEQLDGWRTVTDAVHARGGRIFAQLWHVGRAKAIQPGEEPPVSASAVAIRGTVQTHGGPVDYPVPRPLSVAEIAGVVDEYGRAAGNAIQAGFDGVEVHGANGYLLDQFLRDGSNKRTDEYGGPPENRARFHVEATRVAVEAVGRERVGVRLSPSGTYNDMSDSDAERTFGTAVRLLDALRPAYLHVTEGQAGDARHGGKLIPIAFFRPLTTAVLVTNGGYDADRAEAVIARGDADAVAFGTRFLANPDLPVRFARGAELNPPDPATFYGGGARGYTDYPAMAG